MARLAVPLSLVALAALSACSTPPQSPAQPSNQIVTNVHPYYAGNGTVQSVMPAPGASAAGMQRLEIRMDDGRMQYVDTTARDFTKGSRIQLSQDRTITKM